MRAYTRTHKCTTKKANRDDMSRTNPPAKVVSFTYTSPCTHSYWFSGYIRWAFCGLPIDTPNGGCSVAISLQNFAEIFSERNSIEICGDRTHGMIGIGQSFVDGQHWPIEKRAQLKWKRLYSKQRMWIQHKFTHNEDNNNTLTQYNIIRPCQCTAVRLDSLCIHNTTHSTGRDVRAHTLTWAHNTYKRTHKRLHVQSIHHRSRVHTHKYGANMAALRGE